MADAGVASRRKCEEYILQGRVKVNGALARLGMSLDPAVDVVEFDGKRIDLEKKRVVIAFYKPRGVMCTTSDPEGRGTVMDYFKDYPARLYHVGRLDYDSEGLLIMTNDGALAYRMMHPRFVMDKTYYVVCQGTLTPKEAAALQSGVVLSDIVTSPAGISDIKRNAGKTSFLITIHEGRNRQIRRMLEAVGHEVLLLKRVRVGPVCLSGLQSGKWRELSDSELQALDVCLLDT